MKKNKIVIVALLSLFLTACFSDEGNYSYNNTEEILVNFKLGTYYVVASEDIVLEPVLKYSGSGTRPIPEVTYEWILNNEVVSTDETFKYRSGTKLERIFGYLKVRNVATGEQYAGKFIIEVESAYKAGYTILHENESGNGEISFIRTVKNTKKIDYVTYDTLIYIKEYANIYELANGHPMLKNPISITEHAPFDEYVAYLPTALTLVSDDGNFIEDLNGETFARETKLQDEFVDEILPDDFSPKQVVDTPWDSYLIAKNGLMYTKRGSTLKILYTGRYNAKFTYNDDTKYSDIVCSFYKNAKTILAIEYDKDDKRNYVSIVCELGSKSNNNGMRLPLIAGKDAELLKHFQDVKYEILASDYLLNGYDRTKTLAQSLLVKENGKYFLHVMVLSYNSLSSMSVNESEKIDLTSITGGKSVLGMSTSKVKDHIIFYDENNIYIYDWTLKTMTTLFTSTKKISTVGQYSRIPYYTSDALERTPDPSFAVGYETGEVEIYELEKPDLKTVYKKVFTSTNKYGKIKQIVYKIGGSYDFFTSL